ncbi:MAG: hypothetical protein AABY22_20375 [Nanoarchaeota archaeon]
MSQYILFYSKKDQKSMHFMNLLHKIGIRQNFTCFDVSPVKGPKPTKYIRQFQITHIPTICVDDQYYIGNNALIWLKSVISDMGLRGPQSMSSRQNKEGFDMNPRNMGGSDYEREGPQEYNPGADNLASIDSNIETDRISYIPEDGNSHRSSGHYNLGVQSILPPDMARDLDQDMLKMGTGGSGNDRQPQRSGLKRDALKAKQHDSEFERYKRERDQDIPQGRRRMG